MKNWLWRKALLDLEEKKLIFNFLSDAAYRPFSKTFLCQFFIQYTLGCGQIFMKKHFRIFLISIFTWKRNPRELHQFQKPLEKVEYFFPKNNYHQLDLSSPMQSHSSARKVGTFSKPGLWGRAHITSSRMGGVSPNDYNITYGWSGKWLKFSINLEILNQEYYSIDLTQI